MLDHLKHWVRKRPLLESLAYLAHNNIASRLNFSGTSLRGRSPGDAAAYVRTVAERYRTAATRLERSFADATVLEVGPGDNLAVAVCLVAWGAREVVCIDRFDCLGELHTSRAVYAELIKSFSPEERARVAHRCAWTLDPELSPQPGQGAIRHLVGIELERCDQALPHRHFDCILSNAALEHVSHLPSGIAAMAKLGKLDGWMFHEVDFRSHHRFDAMGPLHFLTVPGWLWRQMTSRVGSPNRLRINAYRNGFHMAGLHGSEEILEAVDTATAATIFPRVDRTLGVEHPDDLCPLIARFTLQFTDISISVPT